MGNALVDAGGDAPALLSYVDPDDMDCVDTPPSIEFAVNTEKLRGSVRISYDRAMDYYHVICQKEGVEVSRVTDVDFTQLAEVVVDAIDDGKWKIAKVEVLKAAKKPK